MNAPINVGMGANPYSNNTDKVIAYHRWDNGGSGDAKYKFLYINQFN